MEKNKIVRQAQEAIFDVMQMAIADYKEDRKRFIERLDTPEKVERFDYGELYSIGNLAQAIGYLEKSCD